ATSSTSLAASLSGEVGSTSPLNGAVITVAPSGTRPNPAAIPAATASKAERAATQLLGQATGLAAAFGAGLGGLAVWARALDAHSMARAAGSARIIGASLACT